MESDRATTALGVTIGVPATWTAEEGEIVHRWQGGPTDLISISRVPAPNRFAFDALVDNARSIAIEEGWEVEELPPSANGAVARRLSKPARSRPMTRTTQWFTTMDSRLMVVVCVVRGPAAASDSSECGDVLASISLGNNPPAAVEGRRRIRIGRLSVSIDAAWSAVTDVPAAGIALYRGGAADTTTEVSLTAIDSELATPEEIRRDLQQDGQQVLRIERRSIARHLGIYAESTRPAQSEAGRVIHARYEFDPPEYVLIQCVASISDQAARARCVDRVTVATLAPRTP